MNPVNLPVTPESETPSPSGSIQRRAWVFGAVAGAAALSGAGLAWWNSLAPARLRDQQGMHAGAVQSPGRNESTKVGAGDEGALSLTDLWQLKFDTPSGQTLSMASLRGKTLLLNFWATWCPPCVEELPLIDRFFKENSKKGWQVLGLAVDQLAAVNRFLAKTPVEFPVALAGMSGVALGKSLGNLGGGLPFTVVLGLDGSTLHRKMGRLTPDDLLAWAALK